MVNPPVRNKPNRPPVQIKRKGVSPEWANLPRRKCDDCGKNYKPARPLREGQRGFCTPNCRKSYHKHGGAYRKLKVEMKKMVEHRMTELAVLLLPMMDDIVRPIVRQEMTEAIVDVQEVTDYGHSFLQGTIRPKELFQLIRHPQVHALAPSPSMLPIFQSTLEPVGATMPQADFDNAASRTRRLLR
jgi:hypothetical protein